MTLEEFFSHLIQKVREAEDLVPDGTGGRTSIKYGFSVQHLNVLLIELGKYRSGSIFSPSAIKSSWSYVIDITRGTDFFDEFKSDDKLREDLRAFLQAEPPDYVEPEPEPEREEG